MDPYEEDLIIALDQRGTARFRELQTLIQNPRTLSKKLAALKQFGMIEQDNGAYRLTEHGSRVGQVLEELKRILGEADESLVDRIPHPYYGGVLEKYLHFLQDHFGTRLLGILLFGSVARGDWTPDSDIDLVVVVDDWDGPGWRRTGELWPLKVRLMDTDEYHRAESKGFTPTLHHYPLSRDEALEPHKIFWDASIEGIILYETDNFLTRLLDKVRKALTQQGSYRVSLPNGEKYWILEERHRVNT